MVAKYAKIFHEEGILTDAYRQGYITETEFLENRRETLLPLFEDLRSFCVDLIILPKAAVNEKLRTACNYFLSRYDSLIKFLDYSFVTSSNQRVLSSSFINPHLSTKVA